MVDYFFPPIGGPGVQRTLGYVKHLAEFGWAPVVLTVRSGEFPIRDVSLLQSVPDAVVVHRTASLEPVRFVKRLLTWASGRRDGSGGSSLGSGRPLWRGSGRLRNLEKWILFPDRRIGWLPFAVARAVSMSRRQPVDIIYSTSTAMTSHLIAYFLKRLLGKPWVADFQDPWLEDYVSHFPTAWHGRAAKRLEELVIRNADRVTVTNEPHRKIIEKSYPAIPPDKLVVIPMGFDPDVFRSVRAVTRRKFTLTHLGNFYSVRSPATFLAALAKCLGEHEGLEQDIEVLFFGGFDAKVLSDTEQLLDRHGLREVVRLMGFVAHGTGLQHLMSSTVLLLVTDTGVGGRNQIPTKLLEYLATGRPILALAPDGVTAEIVRAANAGLIVRPDSVKDIGDAIFELYRRWRNGNLAFSVDHGVVRKFEWGELTARFASALDDALTCAGTGRAKSVPVAIEEEGM